MDAIQCRVASWPEADERQAAKTMGERSKRRSFHGTFLWEDLARLSGLIYLFM